MKHVAKIIIVDENNKYLLLWRSNHPSFPSDPDLPGGTIEKGERPLPALIREVEEETGIVLDKHRIKKQTESNAYDANFFYYLYAYYIERRPVVTLSWEHATYEWLDRDIFLEKVKEAKDNYMHMVYDTVREQ